MDIKDILKDIQNQTDYRIEQRLNEMIRRNPSYSYLSEKNQSLLLKLLDKYKDKIRRGIRVSGFSIRQDMYHLYRNRLKLDLTKHDLDLIRDVLNSFNP